MPINYKAAYHWLTSHPLDEPWAEKLIKFVRVHLDDQPSAVTASAAGQQQ
jgi:hypothetical protein